MDCSFFQTLRRGPTMSAIFSLRGSPMFRLITDGSRFAIKDILSEKRVVVGTGYFDVLEREFYSAIHQAYYGPEIESTDILPDCFEAEERSVHETPEVRHMHCYGVGEEVSACECRCSRAGLPPSKFWLFEPRCGMHDIGGWYVETFGRDKKGRTVPAQRYWDGFDPSEQCEKRLHPAIYLLALAYRTLDLEHSRIRKRTVVDVVEQMLSRILNWCKKLV